jgi:hypothetical protein
MDTPKRKYLERSPAFFIDHLEERRGPIAFQGILSLTSLSIVLAPAR